MHYPDIAQTHQTVTTLSLLYTYFFGDTKFGAVEWRAAEASKILTRWHIHENIAVPS
jgi:hypothetical protein